MTSHALTRRTVLGATLATAAATVLPACRPDKNQPHDPPATKEPAIFDLSFSIESRYRPFELISPQFVAVSSQADDGELQRADTGPGAPFCAVEVSVDRPDGLVLAGLATPAGDHLLAFYDPADGQAGIEARRGGTTITLRRNRVGLPETFRFAFVLCENQVTVLADSGAGWRPLLTERERIRDTVDMRVPDTVHAHHYAWGVRGTTGLGEVRAGLFGMAGIRDQHLVQHSDGRPYVRDGKAYFTATCAGLGFFQQAHWGVFTLDLADPVRLDHVGQLFTARDGLLLGDHAGQVVRDDETGSWIVATSSWGDFNFDGVHVRHVVTGEDVLHGVHVLETARTPLPTEHSSWDPGITRIDGRWHVSFVECLSQQPFDFHPAALATSRGDHWADGLEKVFAADSLHQCEGPILAEVQGRWWLLASDGDARNYPVFDLDMRRVGRLDAPYPTNIPHPQLVPLEDGEFLMITFDGTQYAKKVLGYGGHGDVLVLRSASIHDRSAG